MSKSPLQLASLGRSNQEKALLEYWEQFHSTGVKLQQSRSRAITATWMLTVVFGAAVPLSTSFGPPDWVPAILGFLVVTVQGYQRFIETRGTNVVALDELTRTIRSCALDLRAGVQPYDDRRTRVDIFHTAVQTAMKRYDKRSNESLTQLFPNSTA